MNRIQQKKQPEKEKSDFGTDELASSLIGNQAYMKQINLAEDNRQAGAVQRVIKDGDREFTEEDMVAEYPHLSDYRNLVRDVIGDQKEYTLTDAYDRIIELASDSQTVSIILDKLIPLLDPVQHKPHIVHYHVGNEKGSRITVDEPGFYKLDNLQSICDNMDNEDKHKPIRFTEITDQKIRTDDGRHRIAVYHAMNIPFIYAEMYLAGHVDLLTDLGLVAT